MKNPNRDTVTQLIDLPNIGKAIESDLLLIGIDRPQQLIGKNPIDLYDKLCIITGKKHDLCVLDTFMSVVHFMESGESLPWWSFTKDRKTMLKEGNHE